MKVKRLLVTLGSSFAFAAALVSCGFAQEGDSDYEEKIKTIDLSQYEASYWQTGKTDNFSAVRTQSVETATSTIESGVTYVPYYTSDDGTKIDIDTSKIKGLNSISYDYYKRTTSTETYSAFYDSIKSHTSVDGGAPKEAGEYWVVANFHVDESRYHSIDPWVAKINIYINSPYTAADLVWNDATGPASEGNPLDYAEIAGVKLNYTANDATKIDTCKALTGISSYSYEYHKNTITGTKLDNYQDVTGEGTYYAVLKLEAGNYYNLPTLQADCEAGEAYVKITMTSSSGQSSYSINYESDYGTVPAATTASNGTIATSNLPDMSYEGYVFKGWAWKTGARAGELVVAGDVVNTETTLVAKWTETTFHKLSNKKGVLYSNNFNTAGEIAAYDDTNMYNNARGIYQRRNAGSKATETMSPDDNKAIISDGKLSLINKTEGYGTQVVYDFGGAITSGVVEIVFDMDIATMFTKSQQPVQFYGTTTTTTAVDGTALTSGNLATQTGDIYGVRYNGGIGYRLNGKDNNNNSGTKIVDTTFAKGTHTFYFVFDLDAHTITTTCDGVAWDVIEGITSLSQMRIATGDGNTEEFAVDNLAIAYTDTAANSASFDATKLTTGDTYDASVADSTDTTEETAELTEAELCDGFFTIVKNGASTVVKRSGQKKVNDVTNYSSECTSIEIGTGAGLQFTVTDKVTFTVTVSSTGGSNTSNFYLKNANDQYITGDAVSTTLQADESGNGYTTTGTGFMTITYTLEAGTYTFISSYTDGTKSRGGKVKTMVVAPVNE